MSWRASRAASSSRGSSTSMTSKPACSSSVETGIDSFGGRATMTAGRATDGLLARWVGGQSAESGSCAATSSPSGDSAVMRASKPGQRGDRVGQAQPGVVADGEDELPVGAGGHADRRHAGDTTEAALEGGDARDADQAEDDHAGRHSIAGGGPLDRLGDIGIGAVETGRGQHRQAVVGIEPTAHRGGLGLGRGEVRDGVGDHLALVPGPRLSVVSRDALGDGLALGLGLGAVGRAIVVVGAIGLGSGLFGDGLGLGRVLALGLAWLRSRPRSRWPARRAGPLP